jgi:hypothetical protein
MPIDPVRLHEKACAAFDFAGRQVTCEHLLRRVVRYENDGTVTVIADAFDGKPLNSPNDVVPHPDGGYWFTDPPYGGQLYEGVPDARILNVIDEVGLSAWLARLPAGLDTPLEGGGKSLSAGQAQLLAFARVFLADPGVLIVPSHMGLRPIPGMHGYAPGDADSVAFYGSTDARGPLPARLTDLKPRILADVGA